MYRACTFTDSAEVMLDDVNTGFIEVDQVADCFCCPGFWLKREVFSPTDPVERHGENLNKLKKEELDPDGVALKREVRSRPAPDH